MPEYVKEGAVLQCDKGSALTRLLVTQNTKVKIQEGLVATVADKEPNSNILPFGICSITKKACNPALQNWESHHDKVTFNELHLLLMGCEIKCTTGGVIKPLTSGQTSK